MSLLLLVYYICVEESSGYSVRNCAMRTVVTVHVTCKLAMSSLLVMSSAIIACEFEHGIPFRKAL
jgi:hypothetical protein